jgi:hypothetical protein
MWTLRTASGIVTTGTRLQVEIDIAIHVKHDTRSSRTSKMRRVLLRNMLSMSFNSRWKGLFTGDIVTKEHVWLRLLPVEVFIVVLKDYHNSHPAPIDQLVHIQEGILRIQVENLCHRASRTKRTDMV